MTKGYRQLEVSGSPKEMGHGIGEAAREEIRGFSAVAWERANLSTPIPREAAMDVARACIPLTESYCPEMIAEMRGVAEASGESLENLMLLNVRNQLRPQAEAGCTSFSATADSGCIDGTLIGQNWDSDPGLDPFTLVLTRRPKDKPAFMTITQAGLIAYIGVNDAGLGLCLNSLPAPSRRTGIPLYFILRRIFECTSLDAAVRAASDAERAIPTNVIMATPQGPADLEITVPGVYVLREECQGLITHTNHCQHAELQDINSEFAELIQSHARKSRVDRLTLPGAEPLSIARFKEILSDHDGYPRSICRHPNNDLASGHWRSVFSVIIEVDAAKMHISRGNPCETPYEIYSLN